MKKRLLVLVSIGLLLLVAGCQGKNDPTSPSSPVPSGAINLDSPTGGLTTSSEQPAFGESGEFAKLSQESDPADPYARGNGFVDTIIARGARLYDFRAAWGHLAALGDSTNENPCPLDWSGTLRLRGGIIIVQKLIAFEPGDSLIRIDRSTIRLISHTGPGIDGIQVKLVVPARVDSANCGNCPPPVLELTTAPFSRSFTMQELVSLNLIETVDTCGNAVSIMSRLAPPLCPHGQLMGVWKMSPPDTAAPPDTNGTAGTVLGRFRGIWVGEHGLIGGHLRGVYGLNSAGERVFFGKYIDMNGKFMGILRGKYGPRPDREAKHDKNPRGFFRGEWIGRSAEMKGRLNGHWIAEESGAGYFHGNWGMLCADNGDNDDD